jgi:hypothetical protein
MTNIMKKKTENVEEMVFTREGTRVKAAVEGKRSQWEDWGRERSSEKG